MGWVGGGEGVCLCGRMSKWLIVLGYLMTFFLQDNINDKWTWKHDLVEDYTVKGVYRILQLLFSFLLICFQS